MSAKPHRPPLDLAAAPRVVGCTSTDARRANRGLVGVVRVAKVYGPKMPQTRWKARCGWKLGRKACLDGKAWRILKTGGNLALSACS